MIAGFNLKGRIWRLTAADNDDSVGGAVPSGTTLYEPIFGRIKAEEPTLALLEQGLSVPEIFTATLSWGFVSTGTFIVQHNDLYEVTYPPISPYYGKKFVVIGIRHPEFMDNRRYLVVTLRREEYANSNDLQS